MGVIRLNKANEEELLKLNSDPNIAISMLINKNKAQTQTSQSQTNLGTKLLLIEERLDKIESLIEKIVHYNNLRA